jgi:WD40 repeat protein
MPNHDQNKSGQRADEKFRQTLPPGVALSKTLRGQMSRIGRINWSPDGRILAASTDQRVHCWEVHSWKSLQPFEGDVSQVNCVAFDATGSILASGGNDHPIKMWEVAGGRLLRTLGGHDLGISSVALAWSPNGLHFASASTDGIIRIWDTKTWISREIGPWRGLKREKELKGVILGVAWSWDSKQIAGASYDLPIWDAKQVIKLLSCDLYVVFTTLHGRHKLKRTYWQRPPRTIPFKSGRRIPEPKLETLKAIQRMCGLWRFHPMELCLPLLPTTALLDCGAVPIGKKSP